MLVIKCKYPNLACFNTPTGLTVCGVPCVLQFSNGYAPIPAKFDEKEFVASIRRDYSNMFEVVESNDCTKAEVEVILVEEASEEEVEEVEPKKSIEDAFNAALGGEVEEVSEEEAIEEIVGESEEDEDEESDPDEKVDIDDIIEAVAECSTTDKVLGILLDQFDFEEDKESLLENLVILRDSDRVDALFGKSDKLLKARVNVVLKKRND